MSDFMKNLSSYNLFNNLLPGVVFCVIASKLFPVVLIQKDIITSVFFYYFIGIVIGRVGSLLVEPLLKKINFLKFSNYHDYISASKSDSKIEILSEVNNVYRSILSMFIIIGFLGLHFFLVGFLPLYIIYSKYIYIFGLAVIFAWSYKKQTNYITSRVQRTNSKDQKTNGSQV